MFINDLAMATIRSKLALVVSCFREDPWKLLRTEKPGNGEISKMRSEYTANHPILNHQSVVSYYLQMVRSNTEESTLFKLRICTYICQFNNLLYEYSLDAEVFAWFILFKYNKFKTIVFLYRQLRLLNRLDCFPFHNMLPSLQEPCLLLTKNFTTRYIDWLFVDKPGEIVFKLLNFDKMPSVTTKENILHLISRSVNTCSEFKNNMKFSWGLILYVFLWYIKLYNINREDFADVLPPETPLPDTEQLDSTGKTVLQHCIDKDDVVGLLLCINLFNANWVVKVPGTSETYLQYATRRCSLSCAFQLFLLYKRYGFIQPPLEDSCGILELKTARKKAYHKFSAMVTLDLDKKELPVLKYITGKSNCILCTCDTDVLYKMCDSAACHSLFCISCYVKTSGNNHDCPLCRRDFSTFPIKSEYFPPTFSRLFNMDKDGYELFCKNLINLIVDIKKERTDFPVCVPDGVFQFNTPNSNQLRILLGVDDTSPPIPPRPASSGDRRLPANPPGSAPVFGPPPPPPPPRFAGTTAPYDGPPNRPGLPSLLSSPAPSNALSVTTENTPPLAVGSGSSDRVSLVDQCEATGPPDIENGTPPADADMPNPRDQHAGEATLSENPARVLTDSILSQTSSVQPAESGAGEHTPAGTRRETESPSAEGRNTSVSRTVIERDVNGECIYYFVGGNSSDPTPTPGNVNRDVMLLASRMRNFLQQYVSRYNGSTSSSLDCEERPHASGVEEGEPGAEGMLLDPTGSLLAGNLPSDDVHMEPVCEEVSVELWPPVFSSVQLNQQFPTVPHNSHDVNIQRRQNWTQTGSEIQVDSTGQGLLFSNLIDTRQGYNSSLVGSAYRSMEAQLYKGADALCKEYRPVCVQPTQYVPSKTFLNLAELLSSVKKSRTCLQNPLSTFHCSHTIHGQEWSKEVLLMCAHTMSMLDPDTAVDVDMNLLKQKLNSCRRLSPMELNAADIFPGIDHVCNVQKQKYYLDEQTVNMQFESHVKGMVFEFNKNRDVLEATVKFFHESDGYPLLKTDKLDLYTDILSTLRTQVGCSAYSYPLVPMITDLIAKAILNIITTLPRCGQPVPPGTSGLSIDTVLNSVLPFFKSSALLTMFSNVQYLIYEIIQSEQSDNLTDLKIFFNAVSECTVRRRNVVTSILQQHKDNIAGKQYCFPAPLLHILGFYISSSLLW